MRFLAAFLAIFGAAPALAGAFTVEESGQSFATLTAAVGSVGDGTATIRIAPGVYPDCAVQIAGQITYRAERPRTAVFDGGACEGKATLVLRGRGAIVDGLVFQNIGVEDGNGAGIRIEHGPLIVTNSVFRASEQGILGGGDDPDADVMIDRSLFSELGRCDRGLACAHSIYLSAFRSLTIRDSSFVKGRGGHYVKSRAGRIEVVDSNFDDSEGHATNYMIDLPGGATGRIENNIFVQGADKENHGAFIAVAAEGAVNSSDGLEIRYNQARQAPGVEWSSAFLLDFSGSSIALHDNSLDPDVTETAAAGGTRSLFDKIAERIADYLRRIAEAFA
jgi:hypothetical protein